MAQQSTRAIILAQKIAYAPRAVCKLFDPPIPQAQVYEAIHKGELKTFRIGVRTFVARDRLIAWIAAREGAEICH